MIKVIITSFEDVISGRVFRFGSWTGDGIYFYYWEHKGTGEREVVPLEKAMGNKDLLIHSVKLVKR